MRKMKFLLSLLVVAVLLVSSFAGCSNTEPATLKESDEPAKEAKSDDKADEAKPEEKAKTVELEWYLGGTPQEDQDKVFAAINDILVDEINVKVNFNFIDFGQYGDQMQILMSSGSKIDLMFTSNWANNFYSDVSKGAYQPIDFEMVKEFGPNIMAQVPEGAWDAARVGGKLMAIPNVQVLARWPSILIQNKFADKYSFDLTSVDSLDAFTPLLQNIADNEEGVYPIDVRGNSGILSFYTSKLGLEYFSESNPLGIRIDDGNLEIINLYETDEMKGFLDILRSWYNSGIIRKDAASVTDVTAEKQNGSIAAIFAVNNPDTVVNQAKLFGVTPEELTMVPLSDPYLSTSSVVATMTAINVNSENPEACIKVLNKFFDAEDPRCLNLMSYGLEGTHHNVVGDNVIEVIPNSGYYIDCGWEYGCLFNSYKTSETQPDWRPAGPDINSTAVVSPIMGFSFSPDPVKNELAEIAAIMDEYMPALLTGSVDVEAELPKLNEKLANANLDKVKAEIQSQLDAWKATK